jgi:hypothetical protein
MAHELISPSIRYGVILIRLKKQQALLDFVQDLFVDGDVSLVSVLPDKTPELVKAMRRYKLDFDDAYQYLRPSAATPPCS